MKKIWFGRWASFIVFLCAFCVAGGAWGKTLYVSATSGNDANDGSTWALAKQTIQAGVDAADSNDTVLVTNGTYNTGGRVPPGQTLCMTRLVIDKAVKVRSVKGPSKTFIVGQGPRDENAVRCVWMTNNTYLTGFTLTNGYTVTAVGGADENGGGIYVITDTAVISNCVIKSCAAAYGGGAYGGTLNNCTLSNNSAYSGGGAGDNCTLNNCTISGNSGGGANKGCMLNNCTLSDNTAKENGGGANEDCTLNNCTLSGNSVSGFMSFGGGAYSCTLNNCTLSRNSASGYSTPFGLAFGGGAYLSTLNNCTLYGNTNEGISGCTARNTISYGNTRADMKAGTSSYCYTNDPLFVNAAAGNLRLQSNSPCINTGYNPFAPTDATPFDLDGNPRIAQLIVDKGAYEYQGGGEPQRSRLRRQASTLGRSRSGQPQT